jgi:hypothetical protein
MLIGGDRLSLFEYVLRCVLHRHLDAQFYRRPASEWVWKSPHQVAGAMSTVLSLLAWERNPEPGSADQAFAAGMDAFLGGKSAQRLLSREEGTLARFDAALQELNKAIPAVKRRVVVACASCVFADDRLTVRETPLSPRGHRRCSARPFSADSHARSGRCQEITENLRTCGILPAPWDRQRTSTIRYTKRRCIAGRRFAA